MPTYRLPDHLSYNNSSKIGIEKKNQHTECMTRT